MSNDEQPVGDDKPLIKRFGFQITSIVAFLVIAGAVLGWSYVQTKPHVENTNLSISVAAADRREVAVSLYQDDTELVTAQPFFFLINQPQSLTVQLTYDDGRPLPNGTEVFFSVSPVIGSFTTTSSTTQHGKAAIIFQPAPTGSGQIEIQVNVPNRDMPVLAAFPIEVALSKSPNITINAEVRTKQGLLVEAVDAGMPFLLKLNLSNHGTTIARSVAAEVQLPDGITPTADSPIQAANGTIRITNIDIPGGQTIEREIPLIMPYISEALAQFTLTTYQVSYAEQTTAGIPLTFNAKNPSPGDLVFTPGISTTLQQNTPLTVTAFDFGSAPLTYPVPIIFKVESPAVGTITPLEKLTNEQGETFITFSPAGITTTHVVIIAQSGVLTRSLALTVTPIVVSIGTGQAQNHLYHQLLPNAQGSPDLINHRIIYHLQVGTPLRIVGETQLVPDDGGNKKFHKVAVSFWISQHAVNLETFVDLSTPLPPHKARLLQGIGFDDSWRIYTDAEILYEPVPTTPNSELIHNRTDVDAPDEVLGKILAAHNGWVKLEVEGWLAEDVIGFVE